MGDPLCSSFYYLISFETGGFSFTFTVTTFFAVITTSKNSIPKIIIRGTGKVLYIISAIASANANTSNNNPCPLNISSAPQFLQWNVVLA